MGYEVPGTEGSVPGYAGAVPGYTGTTSWYILPLPLSLLWNTALTANVGAVPETERAVPGLSELAPAYISIGTASSRLSETYKDDDSGEGLIDGFLRCSSEMPGGIDSLKDPNLDNISAASF
jgi:hypothetical protein